MKRLVYLALFLALPMLAIGQQAVGHYTYSHGWAYNVQEGKIQVSETGTMDFYPDGSVTDSALQHYVLLRPDGSKINIDFDYLSPSYWQQEGNVMKFWGDSSRFFMAPVKVTVDYPATVADSVRKADRRWAYDFAWKQTRTVRGSIHKPYNFQVTRLDNQAMDFSYTYSDGHSDSWHFVRDGAPQGMSASEKQEERHLSLVDPSTLEQRAQYERNVPMSAVAQDYYPNYYPKTNNFLLAFRCMPRLTQYDFSFSYLFYLGGMQYLGFGGNFGSVQTGTSRYNFTYGGFHFNLKTLMTLTEGVQPYFSLEIGRIFTPAYTRVVGVNNNGVIYTENYYPMEAYLTPMLGFDFILGRSRTRLTAALGFQLYGFEDDYFRRTRGDFVAQLGFWF